MSVIYEADAIVFLIFLIHTYAFVACHVVTIYSAGIFVVTQPIIPTIIDVLFMNGSRYREFPLPVDYYHLDTQKYYFYIIMYSYPCLSMGLLITIANDAMFIVYVQHCCGLFTALG